MKTGAGKTALITGATSGIGHELAKLFAKDGYDLVLVARTAKDLEECEKQFHGEAGTITCISKDLSLPQAAYELYADVRTRGITVDVLVNDAGQGEFGTFLGTNLERHLDVIQLNLVSLTVLTHLFAREMVLRKEGRILQLASIVSKMPAPLLAVYGATKAYVYSLSQALVNELKDTGVTLTALLPGATDTMFFAKAGDEEWESHRDGLASPEKVAQDGYEALMAGKPQVISGAMNKVRGAMGAVLPDTALAENMRKENEIRVN
jgi:short-subunit dehydrogenase